MSLPRLIPTDPLSRLRLSVMLLMVCVFAPALFRLWCIKGLIRTIRIDGGSMAEALYGNHFRVTCEDCGFTFRCDADAFPDSRRAVCPNCGYRDNELRDNDLRRGERVLVDTWPYLWAAPQRWDLVMLVEPQTGNARPATAFAVKRIAALPLERPVIRDGDLHSDSDPHQKTLQQFREQAVLVHDNDFLSSKRSDKLPKAQRWIPFSRMSSSWHPTSSGFRFVPEKGGETVQWLEYQHWHCSASPAPRTAPAKIRDNDSYNQAKGHELYPVRDLLLRCRVKAKTGDVHVTLRDPPHILTVELKLDERRCCVLKNDSPVGVDMLPKSSGEFQLEAALCDGRFLFSVNRHVLAAFEYDGMPVRQNVKPAQAGESPLRIGANGPAEISHLQVWRDIYHLTSNRLGDDWQADAPLADGRYFLLGDNSPISIDSRHWGGGVARDQIVGRVLPLGR